MPRPLLLSLALALTPVLFTTACAADPAAQAAVKDIHAAAEVNRPFLAPMRCPPKPFISSVGHCSASEATTRIWGAMVRR